MPDSDWWKKVVDARDDVKTLELSATEREKLSAALAHYLAYLKSQYRADHVLTELLDRLQSL